MIPDFELDKVRLFNCDCMDFMADIPDNHYDLAIVDPPYSIEVNHNMGRRKGNPSSEYKKVNWDNTPPDKAYFDELFRISKNQIIWGANHFMDLICRRSSCWIVWDKLFSEDVSFASAELAFTSFTSVTKRVRKSSARHNDIHPTQKPIQLYKWLLTNYAKPNDKIFDSHGGSLSSACACLDMGFEFDGCELDKDYFDSAVERIRNHSQLYLRF